MVCFELRYSVVLGASDLGVSVLGCDEASAGEFGEGVADGAGCDAGLLGELRCVGAGDAGGRALVACRLGEGDEDEPLGDGEIRGCVVEDFGNDLPAHQSTPCETSAVTAPS